MNDQHSVHVDSDLLREGSRRSRRYIGGLAEDDPLKKADRLLRFGVRLQDEERWEEAERYFARAYRYIDEAEQTV
jgi:hypothetical protein